MNNIDKSYLILKVLLLWLLKLFYICNKQIIKFDRHLFGFVSFVVIANISLSLKSKEYVIEDQLYQLIVRYVKERKSSNQIDRMKIDYHARTN